ncbi:SPOR domain-containing protein [Novosphingobium sp. 1949]|uniref:SPOR domain-containing protein n=1 Tax=Novosphingobium organovorum TaxID=2930092 RepID=A0ABT0BGM2_9SPHN|nr:SPOR domain-containing protein [Novosphingobium organovorum]MCJ2184008.1 SPOR domain-containing protein [Novosphingobium organovorum]
MASGDFGRKDGGSSQGGEGAAASPDYWNTPSGGAGTGAPAAPFRADPYEPDAFDADPFADDIDPFAPTDGAPFAAPSPGFSAFTSAPAASAQPAAPAAAAPAAGAASAASSSYEEASELDLGDDAMRLPWLEGDDEDYEDERGGLGQTTLLLILAVAAIILLAGGVFWALRSGSAPAPTVAGGVIEAPQEPYKTKPQDPGGEVVDGTGDTSFAVAEGQTRMPQIADGKDAAKPAAPAPGFSSVGKPSTAPAPSSAPAPKASPAAVSGVGVQVGAYTSKESAEKGWLTLKGQYEGLSGVKYRIVQGEADIGTVYRLQAVPGDLAAARSLCAGMRKAGLSCQVKR